MKLLYDKSKKFIKEIFGEENKNLNGSTPGTAYRLENMFDLIQSLILEDCLDKSYIEKVWSDPLDSERIYDRFNNIIKFYEYDRFKMVGDIVISLMKLLETEFGINRFDFSNCGNFDMHCFLSQDFERPITIIGNIYLDYTLSNEERNRLKTVGFEGSLAVINSGYSSDINIPVYAKVPTITCTSRNGIKKTYKDAVDYNNRESRLTRLKESKEKRSAMKEALADDRISLPDNYDMPLEIGCKVVFYGSGSVHFGKVVGQTVSKIKILSNDFAFEFNCYPCEVVRL